jgi:hypothetical protein
LSALKNKGGDPRVPTLAPRRSYTHLFGWSVVFREAPPANSTGRFMLEIVGSGGIQSCASVFFSDRLVSHGALRSSAGC